MKKLLIILLSAAMLSLTACGGSSNKTSQVEDKKGIEDFTGTWKQTNGTEDSYQEAVIKDGVIEINWISPDEKSLYWAGTFENPDSATNEYTVTSINDHEKTQTALLASNDDEKVFTYKDGELTYEASAMGTTKTMRMEKVE